MAKSSRKSGTDAGELYERLLGWIPQVARSASDRVETRLHASREWLDRYRAKASAYGTRVNDHVLMPRSVQDSATQLKRLVRTGLNYVDVWTTRTGHPADLMERQAVTAPVEQPGDSAARPESGRPAQTGVQKKARNQLESSAKKRKPKRKRADGKRADEKKRIHGSQPTAERVNPKKKKSGKAKAVADSSRNSDGSKTKRAEDKGRGAAKKKVASKRPSSKTKARRGAKSKRGAA